MNYKAVEKEKDRNVRYRLQVSPGNTKLIAEFNENQVDLLGQFIDLLLPAEKQHEVKTGKQLNGTESEGFAVIIKEK